MLPTFDLAWVTLILLVAVLAAIGVLIWLIIRMRQLERHYRALTAGTDGGSLEEVLDDHVRQA